MITRKELEIWLKHRAHPEMADRVRKTRDGISYEEWAALDELVARLRTDHAGLTAEPHRSQSETMLRDLTDDPSVVERIREAAREDWLAVQVRRARLRRVRQAGVIASLFVSFGGPAIAIALGSPQILVVLLFLAGFIPYLVAIKVVEPFLARR